MRRDLRVLRQRFVGGIEPPQPGHGADRRLEAMPVRPDESLVVEASRQKGREPIEEAFSVVGGRWARIHRAHDHAVYQRFGRRAQVRRRGAVQRDINQRVRLLDAIAHNAARTMILERTADHAHAVGQQRRGNRVAGAAMVARAIEGEIQRFSCEGADAVAGHASPFRRECVAETIWLTVSRSMTKYSPQVW